MGGSKQKRHNDVLRGNMNMDVAPKILQKFKSKQPKSLKTGNRKIVEKANYHSFQKVKRCINTPVPYFTKVIAE